ncbi:hypothetical protein [Streptomyces sp. NPDC001135]
MSTGPSATGSEGRHSACGVAARARARCCGSCGSCGSCARAPQPLGRATPSGPYGPSRVGVDVRDLRAAPPTAPRRGLAAAPAEVAARASGAVALAPVPVPDGPRIAVLRDPQGAAFGVHRAGEAG